MTAAKHIRFSFLKIIGISINNLPKALLCANKEATVFFLGLLTPRPKFLGLPSLWPTGLMVVLPPAIVHDDVQVEDVELPPSDPSFLLGGRGESAWAKNWGVTGEFRVFDESCEDEEDGTTLRGFGPGFLRAEKYFFMKFDVKQNYYKYLHILSEPILADISLKDVKDDVLEEVVLGFKDKFKGASPPESGLDPNRDEIPEGLPFVAGSLITSTRSFGVDGGVSSCSWNNYQTFLARVWRR